jgi:hypothetical protein
MLKSGHFVNLKLSSTAPCVPVIYDSVAALDAGEGIPFPMFLESEGLVPLNLRRFSQFLPPGFRIFGGRRTVEYRGRPDAK